VGDIIGFCVQSDRLGTVFRLLEFADNLWPRSAAHVLQDYDWWAMFLDPVKHAIERPTGLSALINVLLFVVEIRVVDARCTRDEDVNVTGDECFGTIGRVSIFQSESRAVSIRTLRSVRIIITELTYIPKEEWWLKISLNVRLLKGNNLTREDMLHINSDAVLLSHSTTNEIKGQKRRLCPRAHCGDA
jgi:hypothetical protein